MMTIAIRDLFTTIGPITVRIKDLVPYEPINKQVKVNVKYLALCDIRGSHKFDRNIARYTPKQSILNFSVVLK